MEVRPRRVRLDRSAGIRRVVELRHSRHRERRREEPVLPGNRLRRSRQRSSRPARRPRSRGRVCSSTTRRPTSTPRLLSGSTPSRRRSDRIFSWTEARRELRLSGDEETLVTNLAFGGSRAEFVLRVLATDANGIGEVSVEISGATGSPFAATAKRHRGRLRGLRDGNHRPRQRHRRRKRRCPRQRHRYLRAHIDCHAKHYRR